jgi:FtsZ-interacting cell division protein ZipA
LLSLADTTDSPSPEAAEAPEQTDYETESASEESPSSSQASTKPEAEDPKADAAGAEAPEPEAEAPKSSLSSAEAPKAKDEAPKSNSSSAPAQAAGKNPETVLAPGSTKGAAYDTGKAHKVAILYIVLGITMSSM